MTIEAKIIEDSISPTRARLTTFQLRYPRFIHCFDEQTEFLSQINDEIPQFRSFIAIKKLQCKIAQYEESGTISFVYPMRAIESTYSGDMITFDKKKFSMSTTDEHRIFTLRRTTNNVYLPNVDLAKNFAESYIAHRRIPQAGSLCQTARQYDNPDEAQLIAFYVADGHRPKTGAQVQFHFRKQRKIDKVCLLLDALGIDYTKSNYDQDTVIRFDTLEWVSDCYDNNGIKQYPDRLYGMTSRTFDAFKLGTLESDGCEANSQISTTSVVAAEQIQTLALLNGIAMNIRSYRKNGDVSLYQQTYQQHPYISLRPDKDKFQIFSVTDQAVYCFTVPSNYLVVRRNGIAYISGNCEVMTHRTWSRNASSSRAIPAKKLFDIIEKEPALPIHWGKNQKGMQANEEMDAFQARACEELWLEARDNTLAIARSLESMGLHKQVVNRMMEPWAHISVVCTATEFDNFFFLRCHPAAQPEMRELAEQMADLYFSNTPRRLNIEQWHLPYIKDEERFAPGNYNKRGGLRNEGRLIKASTARCARVSYLTHDKKEPDMDVDVELHDRLFNDKHMSAFEHCATPNVDPSVYSGNFKGWIQYRKMLKNEQCTHYER